MDGGAGVIILAVGHWNGIIPFADNMPLVVPGAGQLSGDSSPFYGEPTRGVLAAEPSEAFQACNFVQHAHSTTQELPLLLRCPLDW